MSVRVVLVEPSHPGNIGSVVRAMGNMGFADLHLVRPVEHRVEEARVRAAGNEGILTHAVVTDSLAAAIADCSLIMGTSARVRATDWPSLPPRAAMMQVADAVANAQMVALLFGPERTGLSNRHLDQCHRLIRIPVTEQLPSINLAGAVLILLYELHLALHHRSTAEVNDHSQWHFNYVNHLATHQQLEGLFKHLHLVLEAVEFIDGPREILMRKLRRLFLHPGLTDEEINILRGILTAVERKSVRQSAQPSE